MSYEPPPQTYHYPPPPPQPGRRKGLVIGLVAAVVVVLVVAALAIVGVVRYMSNGDEPQVQAGSARAPGEKDLPGEEDLRAMVQQYADALTSRDAAAATKLTCDRTGPGVVYEKSDLENAPPWEVREIGIQGTSGTVDIAYKGFPEVVPLLVEVRDGAWCVSA